MPSDCLKKSCYPPTWVSLNPTPTLPPYIEKLRLPANQTIFVDDREVNVTAAEACGMRGLVFTDTTRFIRDMQDLSDKEAK